MAPLVARLLDRFRPRGGWAAFLRLPAVLGTEGDDAVDGWVALLLTTIALLCLPAALGAEGDDTGVGTLILLVVLALPLGLRLAGSRLSGKSAAILGALLGLLLVGLAVGRALPPFALVWKDLGDTVRWLGDWLRGEAVQPAPSTEAASFAWQRLSALGTRLWWWGQAAAGDAGDQDPIVRDLLTALLVWCAALFGTWRIFRRRSALLGLAPAVTIVAIVAFFRGGMALFYLVVALYCMFWLVAICRLWTQAERWQEQDTDYPDSLGLELVLAYAPWVTLIVLVAAFFPVLYPHPVHRAFWEVAEEPWEQAVHVAERFVGPIDDGIPGGVGYRPGEGGELPSAHLLTSGPELSEAIALLVSTSDPAPPRPEPGQEGETVAGYPRRYWRARTFDTYTGQGWINGPLESWQLPANRSLDTALPPGPDLFQQFERLAPEDTQVYAANAPYLSDTPLQAWERAPGDLAFLIGEADSYTILSRTPEPTASKLAHSLPVSATLPAGISERYLALPESVPQRVLQLARDVAGAAPTGYDRALAIERYLRAYPYTLELPDPPTGRDLVDYFLFERQEGYCDYYASAMVVMARAVGVPARLASGYAQGSYDHESGRWVVREKDAHSWVEVYFSGIGWVEFEPTAGQPALDRSAGEEPADLALPPLPPRAMGWWQEVPWGLVIFVGAALLLVALIVWLWRPRRVLTGAQVVRDRQARLLRWGARLGHPLRDGQTPREYAQTLGDAIRAMGRGGRWSRVQRSGDEAPPAVEQLSDAFVRAQYSPEPVADREGWHVRDLWTRLRRHLWVLWLALGLRKDREGG